MKDIFLYVIVPIFIGLFTSYYAAPVYKEIVEFLQNQNNALGKAYKAYYNTLGKALFFKKALHKRLRGVRLEYRLIPSPNGCQCYCSEMTEPRQNVLNQIRSNVERYTRDLGRTTNYITGAIDNETLILFEHQYSKDGDVNYNMHYNLSGTDINVVGRTLENSENMVHSFISILSPEGAYDTIGELLDRTPQLKLYSDYETLKQSRETKIRLSFDEE